ncbi:hypothetical protein [Micromonospora polyrhachis]|uniref:Uncharacterized protein n=1 Tax=Micromonospora polyrhachis TaxID=1282883 RepID=A0A7W7SN83_9ACTN|nr:hypothetical protein [Micromonospora polyrhachis]MBB4957853.1 hypothetical protein [Micromonospora polyrhachis]
MPRIWLWRLMVLATTSAVLAALYRAGDATGVWWHGTPVVSILDGLAALFVRGGVDLWKRFGFVVLAIVCFLAWRHWQMARLAYLPGPVDVHAFTNATPDEKAPVDDVKSQLCRHLSETHIYPPYAGPADPPPKGFLDVAEKMDVTSTNAILLALQTLPRMWPRTGYLVTGALQIRRQEPRYGISATVTSFLGGGRSAMTTQWGRDWDEAASKTAYWVLATVLPVTRLAKIAPWRKWRGRELPADLFEAYNEGKKAQDRRQLDAALWSYARALRSDPFNADLRLMVASVQEDLGLFLDALDTYQGALAIGELTGRYSDHLWSTRRRRLRHPWRYLLGFLSYVVRRRESIQLRYQYACTLAYSERTIEHWFAQDAVGERAKVHRQMRERLQEAFVDRYWPVAASFVRRTAERIDERSDEPADEHAAKEWLRQVLAESPEAARVVLQVAAAQEMYRLHEDVLLARLVPGTRSAATRTVLRLARDVWAPLRLSKALYEWRHQGWRPARLDGAGVPAPVFGQGGSLRPWWRRTARRRAQAITVSWPPSVELLDRAIRRAQRRWLHWPHLSSYDYYNAACTYGFALYGYVSNQPLRPSDCDSIEQLSCKAVEQLRASLACTESGVAARLRAWIVSSDPDLAPLRHQPEFWHFERDEYPSLKLFFPRPDKVINLRMSAYVKELLCEGAGLLEQTWHRRSRQSEGTDIHQVIDWLGVDIRTWEVLERIARDRARYWRDRADFIQLVREAVDPAKLAEAAFPPAVPGFDDVVMAGSEEFDGDDLRSPVPIEELVQHRMDSVDRTILSVEIEFAKRGCEASRRHRTELCNRDLRGGQLLAGQAREICNRHAARWRRVAEHMAEAGLTVSASEPVDIQQRP